MIKTIYEILAAKKYRHTDSEVGLLKRVGGYWRIENPIKTLGVPVKIYGSDRFGPNKISLSNYKLLRRDIAELWSESVEKIIEETARENGVARFSHEEFRLSEIIFGEPNSEGIEFAFAFNIESAPNEYAANIKNGKFLNYYSLYNANSDTHE